MLADLAGCPAQLHVVCTGRNAPEKLMEAADPATGMKQIRHPFDSGIFAQEGIEY